MKRRTEKIRKGLFTAILTAAMVVTLPAAMPVKDMSRVQAATLNNPRIGSDDVVTWDCVWFGRYPQSDAKGQKKDPVKWRVLFVEGNDAFLIADQNLDVQKYNETNVSYGLCLPQKDNDKYPGYDSRKRTNTAYVEAGGTMKSEFMSNKGEDDSWNWRWWLRSPGMYTTSALSIDARRGYINEYGWLVTANVGTICPALHLDLSAADVWSYLSLYQRM